jgi:hypothetical protein
VAKAQDWPLADEIAKRLEAVAPPPVQKLIAKQKQERGEEEQPDPPAPAEQMQMEAAKLDLENKALSNQKLAAEVQKIRAESVPQGEPGDPMVPGQLQLQQTENTLAVEKGQREVILADLKVEEQQLKNEKLRLELRGSNMEQVIEAENHELGKAQTFGEASRADETHRAGMEDRFNEQRRTDESHSASMEQGAETHMARIKQMSQKQKPEARA